jgi:hypothetical protein
LPNKKSYFRTLKSPDRDSLIRLTKAVCVPNKTRRVVWDSTVIMLRRQTDSLKVENSSDVHWFSWINLFLYFGAIKNSISRFYLQYYKFPNISTFVIAIECMCFPNQIGASFTGVFHAQIWFLHHIPIEWFAIEGGATRGNAWDDASFA